MSSRWIPLAVAALLSGCITGQRPTLGESAITDPSGNEAVDAVLERLDGVPFTQFTADYQIITRLGDITSSATVVQAEDSRRSITVNRVRFVIDGGTVATCNLDEGECEATLNDARVSDLLLTHNFYAASVATQLRADADRRIGDPVGYTIDQAGESATCVDLPVTGGTKVYCALDAGPLARYEANDKIIDLTGYTDRPDESLFATS